MCIFLSLAQGLVQDVAKKQPEEHQNFFGEQLQKWGSLSASATELAR